MANKKISQLAGTLPREIVSGDYLFPAAAGNAGAGYETKKITAQEIAEFVFTGYGGVGFPATQLSGTKDVYLNNSNWINSTATQPPNYGFLMLRTSDGLLTTGSGIGTPVDGDNLGDHTATQSLNMANNDIIGAEDIRFYQSAHSIIAKGVGSNDNLTVKAGNELTLMANKHVLISGDALSVATIPISGDVTITGGNLEIDRAHKLIVNEITTYGTDTAAGNDPPLISISGAVAFKSFDATDVGEDIYWDESNIQYIVNDDGINPSYDFTNVRDGQTLTLYVQNTHSAAVTPAFTLAGNATLNYLSPIVTKVRWGGEFDGSPPALAEKTTNVYTFVNIKTGIFASAVTGYVY
tara:strand:- start:1882 stop:2937 length:1056 start_codon:yes stop_codon:yes gene_type:complete